MVAEDDGASEPSEFHCLFCDGTDHEQRESLLNTRGVTFLGWSAFNRAATLLTCRSCRHVHWFAQDLSGPHDTTYRPIGPSGCRACGHSECYRRVGLLNTRWAAFFHLDWLDEAAMALVCTRCGYLHWYDGETDWSPTPERAWAKDGCLECGSEQVSKRRALLNTRPMSWVGLRWLDAGATVETCQDCHAITWFAHRVR